MKDTFQIKLYFWVLYSYSVTRKCLPSLLENCRIFQIRLYLSLPPTRQDLTQGQWLEGLLRGGEGRVIAKARAMLVTGLLSAMWAWWALLDMDPNLGPGTIPDYSLNWTARSSAIRRWQKCQWCSSPTRRWPSRSRRPFGLKSAFTGQCLLEPKPIAN